MSARAPSAWRPGLAMMACVAGLAVVGLVTAVSTAPPGEAWLTLGQHCLHLALGVAAFSVAFGVEVERARAIAPWALLALFAVLVAMLVTPIGRASLGATRWIDLGPLSVQPSAFYQFLWPVALSSWVARDPLRLRDPRALAALAGVFLLLTLPVLLQPDLGSVMILMVVSGMTLLFAGAPRRFLWALLPALALAVWLASMAFPHVRARLTWWSSPSYQVDRAREALELGGVFGRGPGQGVMKYGHVPESDTDFILPLIGEEWGLAGTLAVWSLFVGMAVAGFQAARCARSRYGVILMAAATVMISFQAAYNMAMVTGLLPVKGLPLPFVSRGGTSILALSLLLGTALRAAFSPRRAEAPVARLFPGAGPAS